MSYSRDLAVQTDLRTRYFVLNGREKGSWFPSHLTQSQTAKMVKSCIRFQPKTARNIYWLTITTAVSGKKKVSHCSLWQYAYTRDRQRIFLQLNITTNLLNFMFKFSPISENSGHSYSIRYHRLR